MSIVYCTKCKKPYDTNSLDGVYIKRRRKCAKCVLKYAYEDGASYDRHTA